MPDSWPSMRSMARWVLPVLVGPRTAVRRPAALESDIGPPSRAPVAEARPPPSVRGRPSPRAIGSSLLQPITGPWSARCTSTAAPWPGCRPASAIVQLAAEPSQRLSSLETAHDVEVLEHAALVLAARHRRRMAAVVDRERDVGRPALEREGGQLDGERAVRGARQFRRGAPGRAALRLGQQALDRRRARGRYRGRCRRPPSPACRRSAASARAHRRAGGRWWRAWRRGPSSRCSPSSRHGRTARRCRAAWPARRDRRRPAGRNCSPAR